jgi:hypothetical protein
VHADGSDQRHDRHDEDQLHETEAVAAMRWSEGGCLGRFHAP